MTIIQRMASYWCFIGMGLAGVFLAEAAYAVNIPPIPEMSSEAAVLHPELVQRRVALRLERDQLHDRTLSHNSKCGRVEEGSAAEASCASQLEALSAAVDRHIQASTQFIEDYNAAEAARIQDSGLRGAKSDNTQQPNLDPMVVDARNVPTGLPKSVEAEIPNTPAGNRVRKGFQAVMDHDWQVALAWFKDALNHEPDNAGIMRLIDLAEYTMQHRQQLPPPASKRTPNADDKAQIDAKMATLERIEDEKMDEDLARALDDFYRNYLPKHPELLEKGKPSVPAKKTDATNRDNDRFFPAPAEQKANWQPFFRDLFTIPPRPSSPTKVSAPRG